MTSALKQLISLIIGFGASWWNGIIDTAVIMMSTSPAAAGSGVPYQIAHGVFDAMICVSEPIAIIFFLIAMIKDAVTAPPEQQAKRLIEDVIKFSIMLVILNNLWELIGTLMEIADGICSGIASSGSYHMTAPSFEGLLDGLFPEPDESFAIVKFFKACVVTVVGYIVAIILAIVNDCIIIASSISILGAAFQRIIKPLVLIPFSTISVAMAAGTEEGKRVSLQYLKTFFGCCLNGAAMVICIYIGSALGSSLTTVAVGTPGGMAEFLATLVESSMVPIITAGMVKTVDSWISRFF